MRTTVELPDELLEAARRHAAQQGVSLKAFLIAAVRQSLTPANRKVRREPPRVGSKDGPPIPDLTREQIDDALFG